jgi:O-succinylbenzoic acid--CoA ligase
MYDWLSHRARAAPERTALVRAATGETLSFAGLDAMVDDLAGRLTALGVESGDHLGTVLETRLAAVCTIYAADRLGVVLAPLSDRLTADELRDQIDAADVTTLVCSEATEERATEAFEGPICSVDDPAADDVVALAETTPAEVTPVDWDLGDTRLLLFTSGTTGDPKVVRLTTGNLLWNAVASAFRLGLHRDDRWLVCLPLSHMGGLSPVIRMPLYGTTVVLRESFDAGRTADDIGNYDVTCISLVPTMLKRMLDLRGTLADSLRVVLLGGAPAPDELLERCRDFSVPVHPTYGMTETASQAATATPNEAFDDIGTVGRPLFWTSVSIRDDGEPLGPGEIGEIVVDGPTVSPGYYGNPEATAAAFGPHGLRTGDVGYRDEDGHLFLVGRVDDRIITGGENVYPREVADMLRSHPMVADAAVVGVPDDEWGELVGALVVPGEDDLTVDELDGHCRERLAGFKLPRVVSFAEELPRTESGTVRRDAVRDRLAEETAMPDVEADDPAVAAGSGESETDPSDTDAPGTLIDDRTVGGEAESAADATGDGFLGGGSAWGLGEEPSEDAVGADDATDATDAPDDAEPEPDPPDFVREVLPEDPADGSNVEADPDEGTDDAGDTDRDESDRREDHDGADDDHDAADDDAEADDPVASDAEPNES